MLFVSPLGLLKWKYSVTFYLDNLVDGWSDQISSSGPDKGLDCALFT